jgi:predicted RNA-binding protein (virulence factor B family)
LREDDGQIPRNVFVSWNEKRRLASWWAEWGAAL